MSTNYITKFVLVSLERNGHIRRFKGAKDINDVKRIYKDIYFKNQEMTAKDIKGAREVDFQTIYEFSKTL